MWIYLIVSTLAWGIAEIFYKKGNTENEKYSHLKTTMFVGFLMGIYAVIILFTQNIDLSYFLQNFVRYLPVASCYIISMVCSYYGVRYIEESICDPIENTSSAIVPILCLIFLKQELEALSILGIIIVTLGLICISFFDKTNKENRHNKLGKRLAIIAFLMPFCYMIFDAIGTFLDIFYTDSVSTTILVGVTENNLEHTANCCYELTFFLISIAIFIFLKFNKIPIFKTSNKEKDEKSFNQKWKVLAAIFEVIGQATYLFALSNGGGIAAVILGAGTVIVSLTLSRIFLKEKLSIKQYIFVSLIVVGIILLSLN